MAVIKRFIPLEDVKKGDLLLTYDGTEEVVESIEFVPSTEDVYNLEVSGNHNYYAERILVHNKLGSYKGRDATTRAAVIADIEAWQSTIDAMDLLSQRAQALISPYGLQQETSEDIYKEGQRSQRQDYSTQKSSAEFQVGKSGLTSSAATQNLITGQEAFQSSMKVGAKVFETEEEARETGLEGSLFDIAQKQSNLYAGYIGGMQSGGTVPEFSTGYSGGTTWVDPIKSGPITGKMGLGCFPADIKVDGKEISEIKIGDMVSSYNEETGIVEKAEIIETFRHKHDDGYLVINGRIKATANHPFYIRRNV